MRVVGDLSRLNAVRYPQKIALIMDGLELTYAELDRRSNRLAHALLAQGVGIGDRVALLAFNRLDYAVVTQAVAKCGALLVPMNFRFGAEEIRHVLSDAEPKVMLLEPSFESATAEAIAKGAPPPRLIALTDAPGAPAGTGWMESARAPSRELASAHALAAGCPSTDPPVTVDPESPCVIMYTSGTTGFPKGVLVSHATYFKMYLATAIETRMRHDDVYLMAVPMFHAAGLNMALHQSMFMGSAGIIHRGSFDPEAIFPLIEKYRITLAILVPTTLAMLAFHPRVGQFDLSSLDKIFYGSMPITPPILAKAREVFPRANFNQLYGSTEAGMVSALRSEDHERWSQTTGRQALLTESRIVDDEGKPVPIGGVGEIIVSQRTMGMIGYWRNPEATRETIRDGWIYTGDLARVEPEGFFTLVDRRKDVIISGGENIYPKEVENVLAAHPAVREVAVFGLPDPLYGESVCAAVVLWPGKGVTAGELDAHCRVHLASYKRPRRVEFLDALPRNASDKVQKRILRETFR
ncbi:MAG TPA: long-chain-fatty-acid--CoA ligase [Steroidobacteraceae bacterium]|nr:long-chain-fatty-acid--CoA ligase [Steroidobacteraceae bacterium]